MKLMCLNAIYVKGLQFRPDCGYCRACRLKKKTEWRIRMLHESITYKQLRPNGQILFVLLTYNRSHIPKDYGLQMRDLQLFWKRLRKSLGKDGPKIRYFAAGEYGAKYGRPHYHLIIYGLNMSHRDLIYKAWSKCDDLDGCFGCEVVRSSKAMSYTAGYTAKKLRSGYNRWFKDHYNRRPEFCVCSQGIGKQYVLDNADELKSSKFLRVKGREMSLPRYYRKILGLTADDMMDRSYKVKQDMYDYFVKRRMIPDTITFSHYLMTEQFYEHLKLPMRIATDIYLKSMEERYETRHKGDIWIQLSEQH